MWKFFAAIIVLFMLLHGSESWLRRRRRRRAPPPPAAVDCTVSDWSYWSHCSDLCHDGRQTRSRSIVTSERNGGTCYERQRLSETQPCGQLGNCHHICENGHCSCRQGYNPSGTRCIDNDECKLNMGGCSYQCVNSDGSYHCTCPDGWSLRHEKRSCRRLSSDENKDNENKDNDNRHNDNRHNDNSVTSLSLELGLGLGIPAFLIVCGISIVVVIKFKIKTVVSPGLPFKTAR